MRWLIADGNLRKPSLPLPEVIEIKMLLLGLAVLTKGQFGLLIPALIGVWLVTRHSGGFAVRQLAAVCSALVTPVAAWQALQLVLLGLPAYLERQLEQRAALSRELDP